MHNTVTQRQFLFIFPFLQRNITSQMWPSGGKGAKPDMSPGQRLKEDMSAATESAMPVFQFKADDPYS